MRLTIEEALSNFPIHPGALPEARERARQLITENPELDPEAAVRDALAACTSRCHVCGMHWRAGATAPCDVCALPTCPTCGSGRAWVEHFSPGWTQRASRVFVCLPCCMDLPTDEEVAEALRQAVLRHARTGVGRP